MSNNRAAIYARVSTKHQTTKNQLLDLEKVADLKKLEVVKIYEDIGISGTKGRDQRPALDQMIKDATRGMFSTILVWSVDRIGRSTAHTASLIKEFGSLGINQFYYKEGVDTSTPYGQAMVEMAAVFAKLERELIKERVEAGIARARAEGKPHGRPQLSEEKKEEIRQAKAEGLSVRKISAKTGVSVGAVQKVLKPVETKEGEAT